MFITKNNKFARASRFFEHFFAVTARLRRENVIKKRRRIFLSLYKLEWGPHEINSRGIRLHLTFPAHWNKRDKVCKKKGFRCHRRRRC